MQQREEDKKSLGGPLTSLPTHSQNLTPKLEIDTEEQVKTAEVSTIINECTTAIRIYDLERLTRKAKKGFEHMEPEEQEMFCAGIIKLGEALTFCRDSSSLALSRAGIIKFAHACANTRNHFVHHQLYHTYLSPKGHYQEANKKIEALPLISFLEEKLKLLEKSGVKDLSKPVKRGSNDFPFEYSHYVICLKSEFEKLQQILKTANISEKA